MSVWNLESLICRENVFYGLKKGIDVMFTLSLLKYSFVEIKHEDVRK